MRDYPAFDFCNKSEQGRLIAYSIQMRKSYPYWLAPMGGGSKLDKSYVFSRDQTIPSIQQK